MKHKQSAAIFVTMGALALLTIGFWPSPKPLQPLAMRKRNLPMPTPAERRRENEQVVAKLKDDPKPESQDKVGTAEMRLAYLDAESKNFEASRQRFLIAAKIKGTGVMGADFGGINDQAAYQAAVCLVAEHKENEAQAAFREFMRDYPMSPLVFAAEKRLVRLNKGKPDPKDEAVLQQDINAQETKAKFETAVCGPKTVAYMLAHNLLPAKGQNSEPAALPLPSNAQRSNASTFPADLRPSTRAPHPATPSLDYKQLAALCHTTEKGTSIDGLRKGLRTLGITSYGLELNREDFNKLPLPAILLEGDHYFALLERHGQKLTVFDTLMNQKRIVTLPKLEDPAFRATVIAFNLGDLANATLVGGAPSKEDAKSTNPPSSTFAVNLPKLPPLVGNPTNAPKSVGAQRP